MHRIKSVGVMSVAKIFGLIYGAIGLVVFPIFLVIGLASSLAMKQVPGSGANAAAGFGIAFGIIMAIAAPIGYGLMGFIFGAIGALVYNLVARWVGGIEMELDVVPVVPALPIQPPPMPPLPEPPAA
ncbi:MAG TPA: hypothetical protein VKW78_22030 [Terriglobales bacterium]|nr:hypothetical protein [Terriglobales bacterium]